MKKFILISLLFCICILFSPAFADDTQYYVVTYDCGEHYEYAPDPMTKEPGVDLVLDDDPIDADFMVFTGWSESENATEATYLPGDVYTEDRDLHLHAVWVEPQSFGTITGPGTYTFEPYAFEQANGILTLTVAETGYYQFTTVGNYYDPDDTTPIFHYPWLYENWGYASSIANGKPIVEQNTLVGFTIVARLTAGDTIYLGYHHSANPLVIEVSTTVYTVRYNGNGYGNCYETQVKLPGEDLTLRSVPYPDFNHMKIFTGWAESADAAKPTIFPGDTYTKDADITLYAVWEDCLMLETPLSAGSYSIPAYPINTSQAFVGFTVPRDGFYTISFESEYYDNSYYNEAYYDWESYDSPSAHLAIKTDDYPYIGQSNMIENQYGSLVGYSLSADLTAGTTYYLNYSNNCLKPLSISVVDAAYIVTYDANHPDYPYRGPEQGVKLPGEDLTIHEWPLGWDTMIFCGWSEDPNATVADYFPRDTYTEDRDMTLYAIWQDPRDIGMVTGPVTITTTNYPACPASLQVEGYIAFTVSESTFYQFRSLGDYCGNAGSTSASILTRNSNGYFTSLAWGFSEESSDGSDDYFLTAELEAGVTYYLEFCIVKDALTLQITPQYTEDNPYGASNILPEDIQAIEEAAFAGCTFDSILCPDNITSIGAKAFANCADLHKVVICAEDTDIAPTAFSGCTDLLIVAPLNSTACEFALEEGYEFRAIP